MWASISLLPTLLYASAVYLDYFPSSSGDATYNKTVKSRKWLFRLVTSTLLTIQIGKRALDSWWGQLIFIASQLLLVEVTSFSEESLIAFSRCLLPSQLMLAVLQGPSSAPFALAVRVASVLFRITPTYVEHIVQLLVLAPSLLFQIELTDEASLTRLALYYCFAIFIPLTVDDAAALVMKTNDRILGTILPKFEVEFHNAPARWSIIGSIVSFASVIFAQLLEANSGSYYDLLWQMVSASLFLGSIFAWGLTFFSQESLTSTQNSVNANVNDSSKHGMQTYPSDNSKHGANNSQQLVPINEESTVAQAENVFLQRARHEDLMTFQAAMSFIHMLLVLFMTSIDLPHLAFVNLAVIAGLLFQEHTSTSLHELVSGVVVAQALSLLALRHQLNDALLSARDTNPAAQLGGVDAIVEQVGLVYCSIRLVAGAILAENFSRHSAESLLLASISVSCSSGYSTRYLCLVMSWMAMFAARIRASAWAVASAWLNSEAELRRFMDHELKVSFAGIMLALEHCLTDEGLNRLPDETVDMLKEALAECKRGKELCFEAAVQRLAYDNAYELRIEGKTLGEGLQANYHGVEQIMSPVDRNRVVYTDWNLVNHILDNAVANASKYGTNLGMNSTITYIQSKDSTRGMRAATLRIRVTNVPLKTERYAALLQMSDINILFEDTVISRVRNHMWSLGSGRNSTHLGLPVAKLFATRLGGTVSLDAKPDLATFTLEVPVQIGPKAPRTELQDRNAPYESSTSDVDVSYTSSTTAETLPPGLVFAVLDDSSMIRSTMLLTLKRDFLASDKSIVVGATPEEAASFASRAKSINADICIVDENLDYDVAGSSMVGTKIVEELRSIGYGGVIVLYSANEKLELSLNWGLIDGFASKSANRLDTKRLLTRIYFESLNRKQNEFLKRAPQMSATVVSSGPSSAEENAPGKTENATPPVAPAEAAVIKKLEYQVFVLEGTEIKNKSYPSPSPFSSFKVGYDIAFIPVNIQTALSLRSIDPNVSVVGVFPSHTELPFTNVAYSPFVRFVAGLPAVDFNMTIDKLTFFANGFDAIIKEDSLTSLDPAILGELVRKRLLTPTRFFDGSTLNQDMDLKVLNDFESDEERNSMIEVMDSAVIEALQRIYKRPTLDNVRKVAHQIKGASIQLGARALHRLAAKLEKHCDSDFDGPRSEVNRVFAQFFLLMMNFLLFSKTLSK